MSKYRAIMTTSDRNRITGAAETTDEKRYQSIHRVRSRIEELERDVTILKYNHPELYEELQKVVCDR